MTLLLGQFLLSPPQSGLENMAIDAALLERKIPTFRIYRWAHPTLSLGYFQAYPPDPPPSGSPPKPFSRNNTPP
jgi:lipoate-protein ligase A